MRTTIGLALLALLFAAPAHACDAICQMNQQNRIQQQITQDRLYQDSVRANEYNQRRASESYYTPPSNSRCTTIPTSVGSMLFC